MDIVIAQMGDGTKKRIKLPDAVWTGDITFPNSGVRLLGIYYGVDSGRILAHMITMDRKSASIEPVVTEIYQEVSDAWLMDKSKYEELLPAINIIITPEAL